MSKVCSFMGLSDSTFILLLTRLCLLSSAGLSEPRQPSETVCALQQFISSVQQRAQPLRQPMVNPFMWTGLIKDLIPCFLMNLHLLPLFLNRIVTMEFYGKNDLSLGVFLERYCFR